MKNVEKNVKAIRRKNQNYFCSKLIIWATSLRLPCLEKFLKLWPRVYKEWHIWRNNYHYHYEQFGILFYMLFRIYNMSETSDAHLNAKLCTEKCEWKILETQTKLKKSKKKVPFENPILISWIFLER